MYNNRYFPLAKLFCFLVLSFFFLFFHSQRPPPLALFPSHTSSIVQGTTSGACVRDGKFAGFLVLVSLGRNCGVWNGRIKNQRSPLSCIIILHLEMHRRRLGSSLASWRWRLGGATHTHTRGSFVCNEPRRDGLLYVAGFGVRKKERSRIVLEIIHARVFMIGVVACLFITLSSAGIVVNLGKDA